MEEDYRSLGAIVRFEMYFSATERFNWVCAVTDRSHTLQYRSEGFGAAAHLRTPAQD